MFDAPETPKKKKKIDEFLSVTNFFPTVGPSPGDRKSIRKVFGFCLSPTGHRSQRVDLQIFSIDLLNKI